MIQLAGISRVFNGRGGNYVALDNVTLEFGKGKLAAITGKSGSGKSTLLNMLTGIDHPDHGSVLINGTQIHALDESKLAFWRGRNVGIVFQFFQLIPTLTVRENLLLAMDFVNVVPPRERKARADALLEKVGIARNADKLPAALSGGEQQRAAIARALVNDPPLLVADEPTGNLDSHNADAIHALFRQLVDAGKTVIVVTHEAVQSRDYDHVVTLRDGKVDNEERKPA